MTPREPGDFVRIRSPLEGDSIRLRPPEETDLALLNELFWEPEVTESVSVVWPESVAGTREWLRASRERGDHVFVIATLSGELIGGCDLGTPDPARSAELGIWLAKTYWDRGLGTDAVRTLCGFGFRELNLARIELHVYTTNPRGIRVYEKAGFKAEGTLRNGAFIGGRYVDVLVMGLLASELIET